MRLLLVEDNQFLAGNICDYLTLKGFTTDYASNGKQCVALVQENNYDVIVLDVMMPGQDGFDVCKVLRGKLQKQTPIIFLTAKVELVHKVQGFESGGDDYLTKPFELDELLCRIKALSSRGPRSDIGKLSCGDLTLDTSEQKVHRDGKEVKVNQAQFQILKVLIRNAPGIVSRQDLEYELWGDELPDSDVLRTHIYRLRNLLDKPFDTAYLETVHGKGFKLNIPNTENV